MNEFLGLIFTPPTANVEWVWQIIRWLTIVVLVFYTWLSFRLFSQRRPGPEALKQRPITELQSGSWYLQAATAAQVQLAAGRPVTSASCMEPLDRAVAAPTILLRALIGLFILLGLLGTVYGLSTAVQSLLPTLQNAQQATELKGVIDALTHTLDGLGAAFKITLTGLLPTIFFSGAYGIYASRLERKLSDVQLWLDTIVLPHYQRNSMDANTQIAALLMDTRAYLEDWKKQLAGIGQQMNTWENFLENLQTATVQIGETAVNISEATERISQFMDRSPVLITIGERMAVLTGTIETLSQELTKSVAGFEGTLKAVDTTFGQIRTDNIQAYHRMLTRNNELVESLTKTFCEWTKDQGEIAHDLIDFRPMT